LRRCCGARAHHVPLVRSGLCAPRLLLATEALHPAKRISQRFLKLSIRRFAQIFWEFLDDAERSPAQKKAAFDAAFFYSREQSELNNHCQLSIVNCSLQKNAPFCAPVSA
jgi:hypothetical protein